MELPVFASIVLYPHCIEDNNIFGVGEGKGREFTRCTIFAGTYSKGRGDMT
jgi:hypothetical protein